MGKRRRENSGKVKTRTRNTSGAAYCGVLHSSFRGSLFDRISERFANEAYG